MFLKAIRKGCFFAYDEYNVYNDYMDGGVMTQIVLLVFELIGTVAFAVSGAMTALKKQMDIFGIATLGLITAVGGGVIRDILAKNTPYIFVKHFYATASLIGAVVCIALWKWAGNIVAMIVGALTVFVLRILAARFRWELPK